MSRVSILFVCMGNICRSPMAESIFEKIVEREHSGSLFEIDSAGMMAYHQGELADARMRSHAEKRGYKITHRSRPVLKSDFDRFDMLIGMDEENISGLKLMASTEEQKSKIYKMTDYCKTNDATYVPDPYYGGDKGFENVIDLLEDACEGLHSDLAKTT